MNDETKKLVEALRSGKYEQTTGRLKDSKGYCCLGVACDISGLGTWQLHKRWPSDDTFCYVADGDESEAVLPEAVRKWLGWGVEDGSYTTGSFNTLYINTLVSLARYNDEGVPFDQIADIIERDYDKLVAGS